MTECADNYEHLRLSFENVMKFADDFEKLWQDFKASADDCLGPDPGSSFDACGYYDRLDRGELVFNLYRRRENTWVYLSMVAFVPRGWVDNGRYKEFLQVFNRGNREVPMLLVYGTLTANTIGKEVPKDWFRNLLGIGQVPEGCKFPHEIVADTIMEISTGSTAQDWFAFGRYKVTDLLSVNNRDKVNDIVRDWLTAS
jgi:hypothetical protein